jgi:hypothetical protein
MIDCDYLLYGNPTWKQIVEYFKDGTFDSEHYLVEAIEKHLQTEQQREKMFLSRLSIEKILNGRYNDYQESIAAAIIIEWNNKLGFQHFNI